VIALAENTLRMQETELARHEVEALVREKGGQDHLHKKKLQKELADLDKEARKLKSRLKAIERRRAVLVEELDG
jgi:uncharacterized protein (DUF3084 family)